MHDDLKVLAACIGGAILVTLLASLVVCAPVYFGMRYQCASYAQVTGKPTKFVALDCYIQDGAKWYVWEEYKHRFLANGDLAK